MANFNPKRNSEGYPDPTAYNAIQRADQELTEAHGRVNLAIRTIKSMLFLADLELVGRIELRDRKTGRYFR